jgi:hypothetical protein
VVILKVLYHGEMRRYPNFPIWINDQEMAANLEEKILVKILDRHDLIFLPILANREEELIRRKRLTRTHNQLESAICIMSLVFTYSEIDLIICDFEIFRKLSQTIPNSL